ncbi:MFS transporter [Thermogymnomonas acidicola]|uniref:MFS transporter n=1 Tax=Thermogymnomonas acidicola TaxID=399579 RepID=UPI00094681C4|nr:MFS transporter [Thermogymnomonas acidicola]
MGSVSVSTNALLQESVRPEFRSRATAIAGIAVGAALLLGIALGPVLASVIGLSYVFLVSGVLALLSLALVPGLSEVRGERLHGPPARPSPPLHTVHCIGHPRLRLLLLHPEPGHRPELLLPLPPDPCRHRRSDRRGPLRPG